MSDLRSPAWAPLLPPFSSFCSFLPPPSCVPIQTRDEPSEAESDASLRSSLFLFSIFLSVAF
jgi:hypothetical protein